MLEILALWYFTKRIGEIVEEKGYRSLWYKVLTVLMWFGGEILGAIIGAILAEITGSGQCMVYLIALVGAAAGATAVYTVVKGLSPAKPPAF